MKQLILFRHAKATAHTIGTDWDRALRTSGVQEAEAAGRALAGTRIDLALISNAVRAAQTWHEACAAGATAGREDYVDWLYGVSGRDISLWAAGLDDSLNCVIVVAHEPGLSDAAFDLAAETESLDPIASGLPTAAFVVLAHDGPWSTLPGHAILARFENNRSS